MKATQTESEQECVHCGDPSDFLDDEGLCHECAMELGISRREAMSEAYS